MEQTSIDADDANCLPSRETGSALSDAQTRTGEVTAGEKRDGVLRLQKDYRSICPWRPSPFRESPGNLRGIPVSLGKRRTLPTLPGTRDGRRGWGRGKVALHQGNQVAETRREPNREGAVRKGTATPRKFNPGAFGKDPRKRVCTAGDEKLPPTGKESPCGRPLSEVPRPGVRRPRRGCSPRQGESQPISSPGSCSG